MNQTKQTPTYLFALGGLDEVGKNTYIIEHDDEILIIDCGIKFANAKMPGFDGLVANYDYLIQNAHKIHSLVITHGHEDHIGGIPHLLRRVNIKKIYAPPLAVKLIERRLQENKDIKPPQIVSFLDDDRFSSKHFKVDYFRVCHSIPDSFGIVIDTPNGIVVETGDYRFDFATAGDQTNLHKIAEVAKRGVAVLMSESTSAEIPGFSESELYIIQNIYDYIKKAKHRVFISTFASNLGRVEQIIAIAVSMKRKIVIAGKSMEANVKTSRRLNYLNIDDRSFVSIKEIDNYKDEEICVILTGSQGEEHAALNVMANGEHSRITLKPTDTIILSSNPIPGNYMQVEKMINKLYRLGVTVYENSGDKKIHSSGHATRSEQQLMIQAVSPDYIFPIHGEHKMLKGIKQNAIDLGFDPEKIIVATNGERLMLLNGVLSATNEFIDATPNYINGADVSSRFNELLTQRNILSSDGVVNLVVCINKNKVTTNPTISTRGCFFAKESVNLVNKLTNTIKEKTNALLAKNESLENIRQELIKEVKSIVWIWRKKNPLIDINLINNDIFVKKIKNRNYIKPVEVSKEKAEVQVN
ncbi:ribonuclease J [Ureaplasma zalophigenitalium]|uniref:Ribonuclease J n=1 Tax=Ureaplasma zalophigenitalium TaxID=907723 RepID=A0ABT3BNJ2_9BACT|nr:ribonuclease J [Ureaplasma zalophigenitalium]MCV3753804.1 ribonuclease J [Ureaplasma zalophigenitalium]